MKTYHSSATAIVPTHAWARAVSVVVFAVLFAVFFLVSGIGKYSFVSAQLVTEPVVPAEVCNGVDDNGDGVADENLNCDHYVSYLLDKTINPVGVVLHDQFIEPTDFTLDAIERLINPARKLHNGLVFNPARPDLHYLAYRVQSAVPFVPRSVFVQNQFEQRTIRVIAPHYLLTPTGKRKVGVPIERLLSAVPSVVAGKLVAAIVPPIPQNANHYLCYDVEPYAVKTGVTIRDQFQNQSFEVIRARYLCNPVEKTHAGKRHEIVDARSHLMCYEVIPHNTVSRQVITHDQFGVKSQKTVRTEELCVPTVKTHLPVTCALPDDSGTTAVLDMSTVYQNTDGQFVVIQSTPLGAGIAADGLLQSSPATTITRTGTPGTGETYHFDTEMLSLSLSGGGTLTLPMQGTLETDARTPGAPVQSFDTRMMELQGQLPPGDPDFDLLRVTAGSGFGLPSPGHTTLTQQVDGTWNVDSFFDITYRIDFVGAPGGAFAGQSGSNTGTLRLQNTCSLPQ